MKANDQFSAGFRVACVVWLDAMLMLDELSIAGVTNRNVSGCLNSQGEIDPDDLINAWEAVLGTNYESVFRPAVDAVPQAIPSSQLKDVFTTLYQQAKNINRSNLGITANIGGEIYAQVLAPGQRKRTAAYYTRPEVAEYLAMMTLPDSKDLPNDPLVWRVADFACGTGTLLRAAYRRLRQFATAKQTPPDSFHEHMMGQGLTGVDISVIASHLTATGLVSLQPEVPYTDTGIGVQKIGRATVGVQPDHIDEVRAGSLELAAAQSLQIFTHWYEAEQGKTNGAAHVLIADKESFDAVLMNPPYSRTRGGQAVFDIAGMSDDERRLVQDRVRKKLAPKSGGSMKAGLASLFTGIADKKLKPDGRLGLVLPMTAAAQTSWESTREMIAENYTDITITYFTSDSMSADTNMGEILLTARKGGSGFPGLVYACIHQPFKFASEAAETARALRQDIDGRNPGDSGVISVAGTHLGDWHWHHTADGIWSGAGMSQLNKLFIKATQLTEGNMTIGSKPKSFPVVRIQDIFQVGPTHHLIGHLAVAGKAQAKTSAIGAFTLYPDDPAKQTSDLMLWETDAQTQVSVTLKPTHYGTERKDKKSEADERRKEETDLFYQRNMRWTSQKILVAKTGKPVMGGRAWAGLRNRNEDDETIKFGFAVWANSIFGFISHWTQAGRQQQGRSITQIKAIENLLCPDFSTPKLKAKVKEIENKHPNLLTDALDRANLADQDTARREIDIAAGQLLGLTAKEAEQLAGELASLWCSESSVKDK